MGYDTTLHLVDESVFATIDKLFAGPEPKHEAVAGVLEALAQDRARGERELGQLLLANVSARAPYLTSRNVALSLWNRDEMGVALPDHVVGALEDKLPALRARFPGLRLPRGFDGNYSTGTYVPAEHVPEVAALLETALARMSAQDAWFFRRLRRVLRVAADRGLGYWEGTECEVVAEPPNAEWLAIPRPEGVRVEPSDLGPLFSLPLAREPDRFIVRLTTRLLRVDTTDFPPSVVESDEHCTTACYTPWGTDIVNVANDREPGTFLPFEFMAAGKSIIHDIPHVGALRRVGDAVVALPDKAAPASATPHLIKKTMMGGRKVTRLAMPSQHAASSQHAAVPFGDGSFLLIWNDQPYRCSRGTLMPLGEPLHADDDVNAAVTLADGSIVGTFNDALMRITPDGRRSVIAGVAAPVEIVPAGDAIAIRERPDLSDHMLRIWWPHTDELATLEHEDAGIEDSVDLCYFSAPSQLLVIVARDQLHAIPWQYIAAKPRTRTPR